MDVLAEYECFQERTLSGILHTGRKEMRGCGECGQNGMKSVTYHNPMTVQVLALGRFVSVLRRLKSLSRAWKELQGVTASQGNTFQGAV